MKPKIGFIGQGYVGKNYADYFKSKGFSVVRYSLEKEHVGNKEKIKYCDIVFIAVPTPTTPKGFDDSILIKSLKLVGKGKTAIIKSTVIPGTTDKLAKQNPNVFILNSPEFLSESTAKSDVLNPDCNVIGIKLNSNRHKAKAETLKNLLPKAPTILCSYKEAELIKYTHNIHGFFEIIYANILFDLSKKIKTDWTKIREFMRYDKYMTDRYSMPVHKSGRGAGGRCFIKDFEAFSRLYKTVVNDKKSSDILEAMKKKNIQLLVDSRKDIDILKGVFGNKVK